MPGGYRHRHDTKPGEHTVTMAGSVSNWTFDSPSWNQPDVNYFRVSSASTANVSGISASEIAPDGGGTQITVHNAGSAKITFQYENAGSDAANRFWTRDSKNAVLRTGDTWTITRDRGRDRWVIPEVFVQETSAVTVLVLSQAELESIIAMDLPFGRVGPHTGTLNQSDVRHIAGLFRNEP